MHSVWIVYQAYKWRGGENRYIDFLQEFYSNNGFQAQVFGWSPLHRIRLPKWNTESGQLLIHLNSFAPEILNAVQKTIKQSKRASIRVIGTVHNSRFYCSNGISYRNHHPCDRCMHNRLLPWGAILNCNQNIPKSIYYGFSTWLGSAQIKNQNFIERFIVPNPHLAQRLQNSGIAENLIQVIPHPCKALTSINPVNTTAESRSKLKILYFGRLSDEKGVNELIHIAKRTNHHFTLIGNGALETLVKEATHSLKNLIHYDFSEELVHKFFNDTDAVICPSVVNESFGYSAIESLLTGKPCFISDLEGHGWIFNNFKNAIPIDVRNPENAVSQLIGITPKSIHSFQISAAEELSALNERFNNLPLNLYQNLIHKE